MLEDSSKYENALKVFVLSAGFDLTAGKFNPSGRPWNKQANY